MGPTSDAPDPGRSSSPGDPPTPAWWRSLGHNTLGERAQSTVEYALLLLGVATLALLVVAWATGTDAIGRLFDTVLDDIVSRF